MEVCVTLAGDPAHRRHAGPGAAGSPARLPSWPIAAGAHRDGRLPDLTTRAGDDALRGDAERVAGADAAGGEAAGRGLGAGGVRPLGLHSDVIGTVTDTGTPGGVRCGAVVCDCPSTPDRRRAASPPGGAAARRWTRNLGRSVPMTPPWSMARPCSAHRQSQHRSRRSIFRRYDHQVGDDTVIPPGGEAALLR